MKHELEKKIGSDALSRVTTYLGLHFFGDNAICWSDHLSTLGPDPGKLMQYWKSECKVEESSPEEKSLVPVDKPRDVGSMDYKDAFDWHSNVLRGFPNTMQSLDDWVARLIAHPEYHAHNLIAEELFEPSDVVAFLKLTDEEMKTRFPALRQAEEIFDIKRRVISGVLNLCVNGPNLELWPDSNAYEFKSTNFLPIFACAISDDFSKSTPLRNLMLELDDPHLAHLLHTLGMEGDLSKLLGIAEIAEEDKAVKAVAIAIAKEKAAVAEENAATAKEETYRADVAWYHKDEISAPSGEIHEEKEQVLSDEADKEGEREKKLRALIEATYTARNTRREAHEAVHAAEEKEREMVEIADKAVAARHAILRHILRFDDLDLVKVLSCKTASKFLEHMPYDGRKFLTEDRVKNLKDDALSIQMFCHTPDDRMRQIARERLLELRKPFRFAYIFLNEEDVLKVVKELAMSRDLQKCTPKYAEEIMLYLVENTPCLQSLDALAWLVEKSNYNNLLIECIAKHITDLNEKKFVKMWKQRTEASWLLIRWQGMESIGKRVLALEKSGVAVWRDLDDLYNFMDNFCGDYQGWSFDESGFDPAEELKEMLAPGTALSKRLVNSLAKLCKLAELFNDEQWVIDHIRALNKDEFSELFARACREEITSGMHMPQGIEEAFKERIAKADNVNFELIFRSFAAARNIIKYFPDDWERFLDSFLVPDPDAKQDGNAEARMQQHDLLLGYLITRIPKHKHVFIQRLSDDGFADTLSKPDFIEFLGAMSNERRAYFMRRIELLDEKSWKKVLGAVIGDESCLRLDEEICKHIQQKVFCGGDFKGPDDITTALVNCLSQAPPEKTIGIKGIKNDRFAKAWEAGLEKLEKREAEFLATCSVDDFLKCRLAAGSFLREDPECVVEAVKNRINSCASNELKELFICYGSMNESKEFAVGDFDAVKDRIAKANNDDLKLIFGSSLAAHNIIEHFPHDWERFLNGVLDSFLAPDSDVKQHEEAEKALILQHDLLLKHLIKTIPVHKYMFIGRLSSNDSFAEELSELDFIEFLDTMPNEKRAYFMERAKQLDEKFWGKMLKTIIGDEFYGLLNKEMRRHIRQEILCGQGAYPDDITAHLCNYLSGDFPGKAVLPRLLDIKGIKNARFAKAWEAQAAFFGEEEARFLASCSVDDFLKHRVVVGHLHRRDPECVVEAVKNRINSCTLHELDELFSCYVQESKFPAGDRDVVIKRLLSGGSAEFKCLMEKVRRSDSGVDFFSKFLAGLKGPEKISFIHLLLRCSDTDFATFFPRDSSYENRISCFHIFLNTLPVDVNNKILGPELCNYLNGLRASGNLNDVEPDRYLSAFRDAHSFPLSTLFRGGFHVLKGRSFWDYFENTKLKVSWALLAFYLVFPLGGSSLVAPVLATPLIAAIVLFCGYALFKMVREKAGIEHRSLVNFIGLILLLPVVAAGLSLLSLLVAAIAAIGAGGSLTGFPAEMLSFLGMGGVGLEGLILYSVGLVLTGCVFAYQLHYDHEHEGELIDLWMDRHHLLPPHPSSADASLDLGPGLENRAELVGSAAAVPEAVRGHGDSRQQESKDDVSEQGYFGCFPGLRGFFSRSKSPESSPVPAVVPESAAP